MSGITVYVYLDSMGIESLFAQTTERLEIELKKSDEDASTRKASAKVCLNKLASLFGIDLGANAELGKTNKQIEQSSH